MSDLVRGGLLVFCHASGRRATVSACWEPGGGVTEVSEGEECPHCGRDLSLMDGEPGTDRHFDVPQSVRIDDVMP